MTRAKRASLRNAMKSQMRGWWWKIHSESKSKKSLLLMINEEISKSYMISCPRCRVSPWSRVSPRLTHKKIMMNAKEHWISSTTKVRLVRVSSALKMKSWSQSHHQIKKSSKLRRVRNLIWEVRKNRRGRESLPNRVLSKIGKECYGLNQQWGTKDQQAGKCKKVKKQSMIIKTYRKCAHITCKRSVM